MNGEVAVARCKRLPLVMPQIEAETFAVFYPADHQHAAWSRRGSPLAPR